MLVEELVEMRDRILPMLRYIAEEYRGRVPAGYPIVVDAPERGAVGIELDPSHALYLTIDGEAISVNLSYRASRYDTRSSASRSKFGGMPINDARTVSRDVDDQTLRNLIAELTSRWNYGQTVVHLSDT